MKKQLDDKHHALAPKNVVKKAPTNSDAPVYSWVGSGLLSGILLANYLNSKDTSNFTQITAVDQALHDVLQIASMTSESLVNSTNKFTASLNESFTDFASNNSSD